MIKTPVTGMKDILPKEMEIRQYLLSLLRTTYQKFGFNEIEAPIIEHLDNLLSNQGWENEKLIFKVLKRGEKFKKAIENAKYDELCDSGLRYDLTLPLSRFYASNKEQFPGVFKSMQFGNVFRADKPQKGRFRQFMQCDIDIFNDESNLSEIELFLATSEFLSEVFKNNIKYNFEINDRRLLKAIFESCGFDKDKFEEVSILLDKIDKVGFDKIKQEMIDIGYNNDSIDKLSALVNICDSQKNNDAILYIDKLYESLNNEKALDIVDNLKFIIKTCEDINNIDIRFNPFLVRGMGYYTATIFEIKAEGFDGSIGGGGRYDEMVSKFIGEKIPACGLSIGFERLITILMDKNYTIDKTNKKIAYLLDKSLEDDKVTQCIKKAMEERKKGNTVYIAKAVKNKRFQIENLTNLGFTDFESFN